MGTIITEDAFKALQKFVRSLEAYADKVENLTSTVSSLSATQHQQADTLANLERMMKQLLIAQGKTPVSEESETVHPPEGDSAIHEAPDDNHSLIRYAKMDFPLFSGDEDPIVWLLRCESYFRNANIRDSNRINFASHHIIGEAQLWYHSETELMQFSSWAAIKTECCLSFGPPRSINALGELKQLLQAGRNIDEYVKDFRTLLMRAGTVQPNQRVDLFTGGLDEIICIDVDRTKPQTLNEAINTARDFSRKCQLLGLLSSKPAPLQTDNNIAQSSARVPLPIRPSPNQQQSKFKFLTPEQKAERIAKNLCYNCDEKFYPAGTHAVESPEFHLNVVTYFKLEDKLDLQDGGDDAFVGRNKSSSSSSLVSHRPVTRSQIRDHITLA
nr:Retrotransposon gag protein [Ipomoea batatas]